MIRASTRARYGVVAAWSRVVSWQTSRIHKTKWFGRWPNPRSPLRQGFTQLISEVVHFIPISHPIPSIMDWDKIPRGENKSRFSSGPFVDKEGDAVKEMLDREFAGKVSPQRNATSNYWKLFNISVRNDSPLGPILSSSVISPFIRSNKIDHQSHLLNAWDLFQNATVVSPIVIDSGFMRRLYLAFENPFFWGAAIVGKFIPHKSLYLLIFQSLLIIIHENNPYIDLYRM